MIAAGDSSAEYDSDVANQFVNLLVARRERIVLRDQSGGASAHECLVFLFSQIHRQRSCGSFLRARSAVPPTSGTVSATFSMRTGVNDRPGRV